MKKYVFLLATFAIATVSVFAATDCKKIVKNHKFIKEQRDNIQLPFVNDEKLLGYWETVDFVNDPQEFVPGRHKTGANELFLKEMVVLKDGKILGEISTWTKGHILDSVEQTNETYEIREIEGNTYLFRQWKSGDYTCRGMKPAYYVLKKLPYSAGQWPDDTNLPFVNDPGVLGQWKSVDFVKRPDDFVPGKRATQIELYLDTLTFRENGQMKHYPVISWTKGFVLHQNDKTASAYTIKEINGKKYMFFEWKSGDYVFRGMRPHFYVLEKIK